MTWFFTIIGALIGVVMGEFAGFVTGGILGYLLATTIKFKKIIGQLAAQIEVLAADQKTVPQPPQTDNSAEKATPRPIPSGPEPTVTKPISHTKAAEKQPVTAAFPAHPPPLPPTPPGLVSNLFKSVKGYFIEGNLIVRIGIVVLFFGVSFLVKYSIDNALLPIELRLAGVALGALALLVIGWRLRTKLRAYALVMQGGGVAILYLDIFASFRLYHLLPSEYAFPLLIIFSILAMILAVLQDSKAMAVTAITGGCATPVLISTGSSNHVALFSYFLILNLSIFAVSWFKSWRMLNVVGFVFTFIVATLWGVTKYRPEHFASTEPFLVVFFLIYTVISIVFAFRQKPELRGFVDGTLVFGVPLVGFGLQTALVHEMKYGLAWSALALGLYYLILVKWLWSNSNKNFRLLCEALLSLGVIFTSLTLPFAFDGRWTAAAWAIEGAGFVWIGLRQRRKLVLSFGVLIQFLGGLLFLADYPYTHQTLIFLNTEFLGTTIVSIAGFISAYLLTRQEIAEAKNHLLGVPFLLWALMWWYIGGILQISRHLTGDYELAVSITFFTVSALLGLIAVARLKWRLISFFPWLLLLPLGFCYLGVLGYGHFLADFGYLAWPFALVSLYVSYYWCEKLSYPLAGIKALHTLTYLLLTAIVCFEAAWLLADVDLTRAWVVAAVALGLSGALQAINRFRFWPFSSYSTVYQKAAAPIVISGLLVWTLAGSFFQFSTSSPVPYIPLINPVDIAQAIAVFVVAEWYRNFTAITDRPVAKPIVYALIGLFSFAWFNVIMFKTIHVIAEVPYRLDYLFDSAVVQMSVSISWTMIGLAIMVIASRRGWRQFWFSGATLIGLIVPKLFLLDMRGTVERIVSFMIVGILLLVVGYFSPVPPQPKVAVPLATPNLGEDQ